MNDFAFVLFGASGDLVQRKIITALFHLLHKKKTLDHYFLVGIARSSYTDESYRQRVLEVLSSQKPPEELHDVDQFLQHIYYLEADPSQASAYESLRVLLNRKCQDYGMQDNYMFHLALPPDLYIPVLGYLSESGMMQCHVTPKGSCERRIIIEKPYGIDYDSARKLDQYIRSLYKPDQIYRIDHYLGKETVQNILVFRFSNQVFDSVWDNQHIEYVEITAVERDGVLNRGAYYEQAGALRDMVQNHLLQLLSLVAMEPPEAFTPLSFRAEVLKILQTIIPLKEDEISSRVVRGQYIASDIGKIGYRSEKLVDPQSRIETYVALKLYVDNERWAGVPFILRTGKAMPTKVTEIVIHFKPSHHPIFSLCCKLIPQKLIIRIDPDEGILLQFVMKEPGIGFNLQPVAMDFQYAKTQNGLLLSPYERLMYDCMQGDRTLFSQSEELMTCWELINPILSYWQTHQDAPLHGYPVGSWGPLASSQLLPEGSSWTNPYHNLTESDNYCLL